MPAPPSPLLARSPNSIAARTALLMLIGVALLPLQASAQSHALGGKVGTSGPGIEYSYSPALFQELVPKYGFRANVNYGTYSRRHTESNIAYRGTLEFRSLMLLADAHPFSNGFRMSAGLMWNKNKIVATGRAAADTIRINGVTYPADAIDNVNGEVFMEPVSPYFGVGWGASPSGNRKLFFSFDFGVIYQRPDVRLTANCGPTFPAAECARLQDDLRREEIDVRRDLFEGRIFPILTIGAGYRF